MWVLSSINTGDWVQICCLSSVLNLYSPKWCKLEFQFHLFTTVPVLKMGTLTSISKWLRAKELKVKIKSSNVEIILQYSHCKLISRNIYQVKEKSWIFHTVMCDVTMIITFRFFINISNIDFDANPLRSLAL